MNAYEARRAEKIGRNQELLAGLDLKPVIPKRKIALHDQRPTAKKRRTIHEPSAPSRASARIASTSVKPQYNDEAGVGPVALNGPPSKKLNKTKARRGLVSPVADDSEPLVPVRDLEEIRAGWTKWEAAGKPAIRDEEGVFHFDDYPEFMPNKSPEEVLKEGCFGGSYYRPLRSRKLGIIIAGDWEELPEQWVDGLDIDRFLTSSIYNPDVNKYKVSCGQSIEEWEAAGWISHEHDVRGWFQWYTRFFQGRRCDDDDRQVSRWKKCVGMTGRWRRMLLKKYMQLGVREVFDDGADEDAPEVSPVMHQTCHHWAYEVRQEDLDAFWTSGGR